MSPNFTGKQVQRVKACSLLCYWAVTELGISATSVANKLGMHQSSVSRKAPASRHHPFPSPSSLCNFYPLFPACFPQNCNLLLQLVFKSNPQRPKTGYHPENP